MRMPHVEPPRMHRIQKNNIGINIKNKYNEDKRKYRLYNKDEYNEKRRSRYQEKKEISKAYHNNK